MHLIKDSLAFIFVAATLTGCGDDPASAESGTGDTLLPAPAPVVSNCGDTGFLNARLSGAIDTELNWSAASLRCESMLRPDDRGVRLRFSGDVAGERLAIIIAMPELEAGATGPEFDSVVTVTAEGTGRFFSTANLGSCWTEVRGNTAQGDEEGLYVVSGTLSCVAPLGEFNGSAFIDIRELQFSGVADWSET